MQTGRRFTGEDWYGRDLGAGVSLDCVFTDGDLTGLDLREADLAEANLTDAVLARADLARRWTPRWRCRSPRLSV